MNISQLKCLDFLLQNNSEISQARAMIKQAIQASEQNMTHCAVCSKKLTKGELMQTNSAQFHIVCDAHRKYATVFLLDNALKNARP